MIETANKICTWTSVTLFQCDVLNGPVRNTVYPTDWSNPVDVEFDVLDMSDVARSYLIERARRYVCENTGRDIQLRNISGLVRLSDDRVAMTAMCDNPLCSGETWYVSIWAKNIAQELTSPLEHEDISSRESITTPFKPSDIRLTTPPMNLGDLIDMIREGWINFSTEYQREGNLWGEEKQSRLIESVLLGLRLPAFYFEEVTKRKWNIIDGLQRCCAVRRFCVDENLSLKDLEFLGDDFGNKKFSDFSFEIRRDIRMLPITVNVLDKGTPPDVKYILFKRLNTGGVNLTLQEIRTAMFQGRVVDVLERMSKDANFLEATGKSIPTKRQEDKDFISRFIAFYIGDYREYEPDLERFINSAMRKIKDCEIDDSTLERMIQRFSSAMKLALDIFGDDAFRKRLRIDDARRPINKAYFEIIATTFAKLNDAEESELRSRAQILKKELLCLMNDRSFENSLTGGTGSRNSVRKRFGDFENVVRKVLTGEV